MKDTRTRNGLRISGRPLRAVSVLRVAGGTLEAEDPTQSDGYGSVSSELAHVGVPPLNAPNDGVHNHI